MKLFKFSEKYQFLGKTTSTKTSEISKAMTFKKTMATGK